MGYCVYPPTFTTFALKFPLVSPIYTKQIYRAEKLYFTTFKIGCVSFYGKYGEVGKHNHEKVLTTQKNSA